MNDNEYKEYLLNILRERFNASELRDLCFSLGIDYEGLEGNQKNDKTRELIGYLRRRYDVYSLVKYGKKHRPDIEWKYQVEMEKDFIPCSPWSNMPGSEIAVCFTPKEYPCILKVVRFFIPELGQPTTNFVVRIYSDSDGKQPGTTLNQRTIYGRGTEYAGWVEVDISKDSIILEEGGFFVSMVWLTAPIPENKGHTAQFLGAKKGHYPLRTYFKQGADGFWYLPKHRHGLIEIVTKGGELIQNP